MTIVTGASVLDINSEFHCFNFLLTYVPLNKVSKTLDESIFSPLRGVSLAETYNILPQNIIGFY